MPEQDWRTTASRAQLVAVCEAALAYFRSDCLDIPRWELHEEPTRRADVERALDALGETP